MQLLQLLQALAAVVGRDRRSLKECVFLVFK
jgi:hypothetical protein